MPKGNPGVPRIPIEDRLLSHVEKLTESGCWIWMGKLRRRIDDSERYGVITIQGREQYVHRTMFLLRHGKITHGLEVCHKCDIRCCINPDHLYSGTRKRNLMDAVSRGRMSRKLGILAVREIRNMIRGGFLPKEISRRFGVNRTTIQRIRSRKIWAGLE